MFAQQDVREFSHTCTSEGGHTGTDRVTQGNSRVDESLWSWSLALADEPTAPYCPVAPGRGSTDKDNLAAAVPMATGTGQ